MNAFSQTEYAWHQIRYAFILILGSTIVPLLFISCSSKETKKAENKHDTTVLKNEQDSTKYYKYHIIYKDSITEAVLADRIQKIARADKEQFLNKMPEDTSQFYITPWELRVEFHRTFDSSRFTSYLKEFYQYTGGAHGMPANQALTLDKKKNALIMIPDIFQDTTAAYHAISQYAEDQLATDIYDKKTAEDLDASNQEWLMEGAAPNTNNYSTSFPARPKNDKATGIKVIFSAYQVGPYAIGMPQVFIPASVFYDDLKTGYQSAFMR